MKKTIIYSLLFAASLLVSCSEYLDTEPEGGSASDEQIAEMLKKDPESVILPMMTGAVYYLHNGTYRGSTDDVSFKVWMLAFDMYGNDMVLTDPSNWFGGDYSFSNNSPRRATGTRAAQNWYCFYKVVYKANQVLDLIAKLDDAAITDNILAAKAQALTYRAFGYYYLLSIYRDDFMHGGKNKPGLPYYREVGPVQGCTEVQKMYTELIKDLQDAVTIFEEAEYDPSSSKTDIDQTVANMVLARMALNAGKYDIAAAAAGEVTKAYQLMDPATYTEGTAFATLSNSEAMWGYEWTVLTSIENNAFLAFSSFFSLGYGGFDQIGGSGYYIAIDKRLYDKIEATDCRKENFLTLDNPITAETETPYISVKFNSPDSETGYYADDIYMRVAEAYLLKAEAEARGGNASAAQQTLFDLVSTRDEAYEKSTNTGDALLEEIYLHNRIELWGEGHEFFTNKRFGKTTDRRAAQGESNHVNKLVLETKQMTFQIPQSLEISHNPHMTEADQNPL